MTRLSSEHDLTEIGLRLDVGGGAGVRKITRDDVRRLLEEVTECWAGNLPDWADFDGRLSTGFCEPDDNDPVPYTHITRIENIADSAEQMARQLGLSGKTHESAAWQEISETIYSLLEDIDHDDPCCIENKEKACCDSANVLCREAGDHRCVSGPNPGGPATAARR